VPVTFYKKLGETSFGAIQRFREENPEYKDEKIAFAGRLDPMAEGEMLFLTGEETKRKEDFLGMDKVYETEFVFGIETDSHDLMGSIQKIQNTPIEQSAIEKNILERTGKQKQKFPAFSKRHVQGKAMFVWAAEGRLNEIEIPEHEVEIYSIEILHNGEKTFGEIRDNAVTRISDVVGDFRQEQLINEWNKNPTDVTERFQTITLKVFCSTGTYIRQLAQDIGTDLGCGATVFSIKRTAIIQKKTQ